jgi:hypothetical protein
MLFLGANLIECLTTAAWISNPQPPGAHLSHNDNADLSARKPRESEDRHPVDVEHLEVLGGAEIPDLVSGTGGLRGASPASSGFRRTQYVAGRVVSSRAKVRASTNQCRAHRNAGPRGLSRANGVTAPRCPRSLPAGGRAVERGDRPHFVHGLMHCSKITSSCCVRIPSFPLDLNGSTVVTGSAGKDHQVATRDLILAADQLTDWSDCINDGCPRRVGHEALQWL